jgi:hypothetical protein
MSLQRNQIESVVAMALAEDAPFGDVTSQTSSRRPPPPRPSWWPGNRACSQAPRSSRWR